MAATEQATASQADPLAAVVTTPQDRGCAIFVRAALFPWKVDWHGKGHHHAIHPALDALDRVRKDLVEKRQTPFSTLFPRGVLLVPSASATGGAMQWNGRPNMKDGNHVDAATVEVIPNALSVRCMECPEGAVHDGVKAYLRAKEAIGPGGQPSKEQELVVCTNRVLQRDYYFDGGDNASPNLLEERRDLPAQTMSVVEETLTRELSKLQVVAHDDGAVGRSRDGTEQPILRAPDPSTMSCIEYATMELRVARVAECMYETTEKNEVRKGSALRPAVGFSLLPASVRKGFQDRCAKVVAARYTAGQFPGHTKADARACVDDAWAAARARKAKHKGTQ